MCVTLHPMHCTCFPMAQSSAGLEVIRLLRFKCIFPGQSCTPLFTRRPKQVQTKLSQSPGCPPSTHSRTVWSSYSGLQYSCCCSSTPVPSGEGCASRVHRLQNGFPGSSPGREKITSSIWGTRFARATKKKYAEVQGIHLLHLVVL